MVPRPVRGLAIAGVACGVIGYGVAGAADDRPPAARAAETRPATTQAASTAGWRSLFDGKTLNGWKPAEYGGQGEPAVEDGNLVLPSGVGLTGVTYTGDVPKMNYEVSLEAQRVDGTDFFCGLTFPVGESYASLIIGGWGGALCGISSLDGEDAAHNETRTLHRIENKRWYKVRLRVLPERLVAWLDDDKIIDVSTKGKEISLRQDIEASKPFGLASWQSTAAVRDIKVRKLGEGEK